MKIGIVGGGPAGLYFAILMKKADPAHDIVIYERNAADTTFGWGVVFSDETLGNLLEADPETHREITQTFAHWDAIDIHLKGEVLRSSGHGFSGIARMSLLRILQQRALSLGVRIEFNREVDQVPDPSGFDLLVGADGIRSRVRATWEDGWMLVRASNTTANLTVRVEARTPEAKERIIGVVRAALAKHPVDLGPLDDEDGH